MVVDVLRHQPEWEDLSLLARRTAVFRKTGPFTPREWCDQPAVVRKSRFSQLAREVSNGLARLLRGDLAGVQATCAADSADADHRP